MLTAVTPVSQTQKIRLCQELVLSRPGSRSPILVNTFQIVPGSRIPSELIDLCNHFGSEGIKWLDAKPRDIRKTDLELAKRHGPAASW